MEDKKSTTGHYNALVWLLMTSWDPDSGYTPSKYLLDSLKPKIKKASDLPLEVCDTTLFDFTIAAGVKDYMDLLWSTTYKFENALFILSYSEEKYIVRDYYLANLAKQFTCWDIAYINCNSSSVDTSVFNFIVTPDQLPNRLTEIIEKA